MATLEQLQQALIAADKAGATDDARALAQAILAVKQPSAPAAPRRAPVDDPGFGGSLLIGAGRTFDRIGKGMQQLYYGATGNDAAQAALKQSAADDDAAYAGLRETRPWATGIGEAAPSMVLPGGGAATLLGNAGRMAASAALPAMLEYGTAGERLQRGTVAGAAGAAVPVVGAGAKTAWALAEPLFSGGRNAIAGRVLNRAAGESAPDVLARLKSAGELVPGSQPTAAQVAKSGGIAALERSASAANPEAYTRRFMEQASARLDALRGIAGDDAAMQAAKAARSGAVDDLYKQADMGVAPVDGFFRGLAMRPQFKDAVARAQLLAKNEGVDDIFFRGNKGEPVALLGQGAHYIKKALDEVAEPGASSYTGKAGAAAARNTQSEFLAWLEKSIPEYGAARQAFADLSKPINRMEVGQELLNKARPALADFGALGRESGATYARALRDADATAARATGFPGAKLASVMTPDQMAALEAVASDLARKANAQDLGRGVGSDTFQKLAMQNIAHQSGMPSAVGGLLSMPGVSRAAGWLYRDSDQQMQGLLADLLMDPKMAAAVMEKAGDKVLKDSPALRRLLEQSVMRGGGLLGPLAAIPPSAQ